MKYKFNSLPKVSNVQEIISYLVDSKKTKTDSLIFKLKAVISFSRSWDDVPPSKPERKGN